MRNVQHFPTFLIKLDRKAIKITRRSIALVSKHFCKIMCWRSVEMLLPMFYSHFRLLVIIIISVPTHKN